jgi:hypothetical protein
VAADTQEQGFRSCPRAVVATILSRCVDCMGQDEITTQVQADEADSMGHQGTESRPEQEPGTALDVPHNGNRVSL